MKLLNFEKSWIKPSVTCLVLAMLTGCGAKNVASTSSRFDSEAKEICSLIEETWITYQSGDLSDPNTLDILKAGWYLTAQDMAAVAEKDSKFSNFKKGLDDAFEGNYSSMSLKEVLDFCEIE